MANEDDDNDEQDLEDEEQLEDELDETGDDEDDAGDEDERPREDRGERSAPVGMRTLGIERYVQFGFITLCAVAFWILDKVVAIVWDKFAEPQSVQVALTALLISIVLTVYLYKHEKVNSFAHEAASELSKVTWPTRRETWSNTVVVVITSLIAAGILFVFDAAWSWVTDLIYKG
jgi:preprotein translocase subunit SecE